MALRRLSPQVESIVVRPPFAARTGDSPPPFLTLRPAASNQLTPILRYVQRLVKSPGQLKMRQAFGTREPNRSLYRLKPEEVTAIDSQCRGEFG